jgi:transcriptional regulator GlxA family with amidase domain
LLERLKGDDRWRHLPVIMLTAKANIRAKLKALRIGVDDYLTKPFAEEELKVRIANLLHNYRERLTQSGEQPKEAKVASEQAPAPIMSQADAEWLESLEQLVLSHLDDQLFNLSWIGTQLSLSERQLRRRLRQLTGMTPNQYLRELRLQQARSFIEAGTHPTVKAVSAAVGFRDTRYFSRLFQERFGIMPSQLQQG